MPKETAADDVDRVDPEILIGEVRKCPGIWDSSNEDHRDKLKKRKAWFDLCRKFASDFDEKSEVEKNDFCNKLTNKWRNVKDNYYRYVKKRAQLGSKAGRSYLYAKHLSFLPAAHHWTTSHIDPSETYSESSDSVHIELGTTSQASDSASPTRPPKRRREIASSPIHVLSAPAVPSNPSMDEDRMFFESVIPIVRNLDIDQKLEFRMEVMKLLKRVRLMTSQQPGQQYECQNCGHGGTEQQQYRGRPVRSSKRASTVEASSSSYQAPVTYLMQDLHPDCVQKYEDDDSLDLVDYKRP